MLQKMWMVPASPEFIKFVEVVGFTGKIPEYEHRYLGHQLTTKNSLAKKADVEENNVRIMYSTIVEGRKFCYDFSNNTWYVQVDN